MAYIFTEVTDIYNAGCNSVDTYFDDFEGLQEHITTIISSMDTDIESETYLYNCRITEV